MKRNNFLNVGKRDYSVRQIINKKIFYFSGLRGVCGTYQLFKIYILLSLILKYSFIPDFCNCHFVFFHLKEVPKIEYSTGPTKPGPGPGCKLKWQRIFLTGKIGDRFGGHSFRYGSV